MATAWNAERGWHDDAPAMRLTTDGRGRIRWVPVSERELPRLSRLLMWQGCLSAGEAAAAIAAYRRDDGTYGGGEAVAHYGGARRLIADALRNRGRWSA